MKQMPKRKKSKDNPYTIFYIEKNDVYAVRFKDSRGKLQEVELTSELYELFNNFELEDISAMHKFDKHIEHSELLDSTLFKRSIKKSLSVDYQVEKKIIYEELMLALKKLSETQQRRIKMYFFDNMTLDEISKLEKCSFQAISKSINLALENLNKLLKK